MTDALTLQRKRFTARPRMILDEAIRIIGQRGYYGFTIKELADNCGLTVAGVLHHFGSKVALLVALLKDRDERDSRLAFAGMAIPADAAADQLSLTDVRTILHNIVAHNSGQPELVRLYSMLRTEAVYPQHPAFDYFQKRTAMALETFTAMLQDKVDAPRSVAIHLLGLMGGLEDIWLRDQQGIDLVAEWDRAADRIFGENRSDQALGGV
ncbi:TetR/AcrR family transcriptional regulator [Novosphingobium sp. G106]|uniref:TetR/AcrR family transcriptional regulator n=1 Tax=Novosphingobium sp. G106 TaxID=2849500 RepID=UPI001C2D97B9|nr:TetR/AcrR family transcriptional regulator [Novosphingobium sp. G106]MBV1687777.1 TetR/AcrR family transcriptional regulator [Novosphingobium sp. G106]